MCLYQLIDAITGEQEGTEQVSRLLFAEILGRALQVLQQGLVSTKSLVLLRVVANPQPVTWLDRAAICFARRPPVAEASLSFRPLLRPMMTTLAPRSIARSTPLKTSSDP